MTSNQMELKTVPFGVGAVAAISVISPVGES